VIPMLVAQAGVAAPGPDLVPPVWRMMASFLVVLAILALVAWALRRGLAARRTGGAMSVDTALSLGERRSLVIVTVENRRLLIGLAPGHVSLVTELRPPSFADALARTATPEVTT